MNGRNIFWVNHRFFEASDDGVSHSKSNKFERDYVVCLVHYLTTADFPGIEPENITVLSPYLGQVRSIKTALRKDERMAEVKVTAVDNYQGEENDIIIVLVRSNRNNSIGFLAVANRINVALTRAKKGLYIIGDSSMVRNNHFWSEVLDRFEKDSCFGAALPVRQLRAKDEMGARLAALEALAEGKLLEESDPVDQYDTLEVANVSEFVALLGDAAPEVSADSVREDRGVAERWRGLGGRGDDPRRREEKGKGKGSRDGRWADGRDEPPRN